MNSPHVLAINYSKPGPAGSCDLASSTALEWLLNVSCDSCKKVSSFASLPFSFSVSAAIESRSWERARHCAVATHRYNEFSGHKRVCTTCSSPRSSHVDISMFFCMSLRRTCKRYEAIDASYTIDRTFIRILGPQSHASLLIACSSIAKFDLQRLWVCREQCKSAISPLGQM